MADDGVQHGIDDNPSGDAEKGATLGGVGGAVTGAIAGAAAGPVGAVIGAVIGGVAGAVASGAAVAAVDRVDNDNTVTGVGTGATADVEDQIPTVVDNGVPGVQTGGYANDGTPDTRGITEKAADAITGDVVDDKTGRVVDHPDTPAFGTPIGAGATVGAAGTGYGTGTVAGGGLGVVTPVTDLDTGTDTDLTRKVNEYEGQHRLQANTDPDSTVGVNRLEELGETTPSIKTGGTANDGTPDTRGIGEKVVDAVTGDTVDDKTGKVVDHP